MRIALIDSCESIRVERMDGSDRSIDRSTVIIDASQLTPKLELNNLERQVCEKWSCERTAILGGHSVNATGLGNSAVPDQANKQTNKTKQ
jgi:hypothetical protein